MQAKPTPICPRKRLMIERGVTALVLVALVVTPAYAQATTAGTTLLQNILNIITGTAGQIVCGIIVALAGFACATGRMTLWHFLQIGAGVAIVFSASWIVSQVNTGS